MKWAIATFFEVGYLKSFKYDIETVSYLSLKNWSLPLKH